MRIIGGVWRGRHLQFPQHGAVRPTPDRVRETLFNWLQARIVAARCLDLFAGSGALGIEALSRGAAAVTFVEKDRDAARQLEASLKRLGTEQGQVVCGDALGFLGGPSREFDLVFLDPPYAAGLLAGLCRRLEAGGWLAPGALVYLEGAARDGPPALPAAWSLLRSRTAGDVGYHLATRGAAPDATTSH